MNRFAVLVLFPLLLAPTTTSRTAHAAGADSFGVTVLGCFHPDAKFTSASYARGRNTHAWTGWITFRDGRREGAAMSFVMDMKTRNGDTFFRVLPLMDDASSAPAPGCYLREWQQY